MHLFCVKPINERRNEAARDVVPFEVGREPIPGDGPHKRGSRNNQSLPVQDR